MLETPSSPRKAALKSIVTPRTPKTSEKTPSADDAFHLKPVNSATSRTKPSITDHNAKGTMIG